MHHIIPSLVHALGLHAFGMATPPSLGVLGGLGELGVAGADSCLLHPSSTMPVFVKSDPSSPPLVVLAAFGLGDCDYICSMSHMICMQHMAAKFSQRSIFARRIS